MWYSLEALRARLADEDREVRRSVFERLFDVGRDDPTIAEAAQAAVDRYGWRDALPFSEYILEFRQTDASMRWWLARVDVWSHEFASAPAQGSSEPEMRSLGYSTRDNVHELLTRVDLDLLRTHAAAIVALPDFSEELREEIAERLRSAEGDSETLYAKLVETCRQYAAATIDEQPENDEQVVSDEVTGAMLAEIRRLTDVVGRLPPVHGDEVLGVLDDTDFESPLFREVAAELVGAWRLPGGAAALFTALREADDQDDFLLESVCAALPRFPVAEVVPQIAAEYSSADWDYRNCAIEILGRILDPSATTVALDCARIEADDELQSRLLRNAVHSFDVQTFEPAREFLQTAEKNLHVLELRRSLLDACRVAGVRFPEYDAWLADSAHDAEYRRAWARSQAEQGQAHDHDHDDHEHGDDCGCGHDHHHHHHGHDHHEHGATEDYSDDDLPSADERHLQPVAAAGRNDPCPCGSGKKYKKCCLLGQ